MSLRHTSVLYYNKKHFYRLKINRGNTFLANYNFIRVRKRIADITMSLQPSIYFLNYDILQTISGGSHNFSKWTN